MASGVFARPDLLVCDLDGTLVDARGEAFPGVAAALRDLQAVGVRFTVCTGRPYVPARRLLRRAGLAPSLLACYHGALVVDLASRSCLRHLQMAEGDVVLAASLLWECGLRVTRYSGVCREELCVVEGPPRGAVTRLIARGERAAVDRAIAGLAPRLSDRVRVRRVSGDTLELLHEWAEKGSSLAFIAERYGVPLSRVLAMGDDECDLPMLRACGLGVVVAAPGAPMARAARSAVAPEALAAFLRSFVCGRGYKVAEKV